MRSLLADRERDPLVVQRVPARVLARRCHEGDGLLITFVLASTDLPWLASFPMLIACLLPVDGIGVSAAGAAATRARRPQLHRTRMAQPNVSEFAALVGGNRVPRMLLAFVLPNQMLMVPICAMRDVIDACAARTSSRTCLRSSTSSNRSDSTGKDAFEGSAVSAAVWLIRRFSADPLVLCRNCGGALSMWAPVLFILGTPASSAAMLASLLASFNW